MRTSSKNTCSCASTGNRSRWGKREKVARTGETKQVYVGGVKTTAYAEPLYEHKHNLSHTASGYGGKIPTRWVVEVPDARGVQRKYRVYVAIFGNAGTAYILRGKPPAGKRFTDDNIVEG